MNVDLFKSLLRPYWNTWSVNNLSTAANRIATAYDLANIGDSGPFFGAKLIKGNKNILQQFLSNGLILNYSLTTELPAPFVVKYYTKKNDKDYVLIGGFKRSSIALEMGIEPIKVWFIDLTI